MNDVCCSETDSSANKDDLLRDIFNEMDKNGNGTVSQSEWKGFISQAVTSVVPSNNVSFF